MRASWLVARVDLRRRWISVVVLTLLVGLVSAVVLGALAGARRTSTAFDRFKDETRAADLNVFIPAIDDATMAQLRALPGVESIGQARQILSTVNGTFVAVAGPLDATVGHTAVRPRLLEGRRPRQDHADEVAVPEPLARAGRVVIGDTITLRGYAQGQIDVVLAGGQFAKPAGPKVLLHVVGITREPQDLSIQGSGGGVLFTTRRFVREYGDQIGRFAPVVLLVRVTDDAAARAFVQKARKLVAPLGQSGEFQVQPPSENEGAVQQSIDVLSAALLAFAVVVALAGLVIIAIALRRFVDGAASDVPALRGLGVIRGGRISALGLPLVPVIVGGAVVGVVGAWLASPLMPLGIARDAEPHPGLDVDGLVLGAGFVAVIVVVGALGWIASRAAVRAALPNDAASRQDPSTAASVAMRAGWAPPVTVGMAMALEPGRGRTAVPVRPAIAGAIVAVVGVVAVGVFGASLAHLVSTPAAYGYNWDTHFTTESPELTDSDHPCSALRSALVDERAVAAVAAVCANTVEVNGHAVGAYGFVPISGTVEPVVLEGRLPRTAREVALGSDTVASIQAELGDRVEIAGPARTRNFRLVGRVVLPKLGADTDVQAVADGAILTGTGLESLSGNGDLSSVNFLVRWRPGADVIAARARIADLPGDLTAARPVTVPLEVTRLDQLNGLPWILGGVLALIGVLGVGYALVTAVRRRARDLAVLKTLGFRRRQVIETVAMQATVFALIGLAVGVPLGLVVGRLVWQQVADGAGLASDTTLPALVIASVAVATLVVVNVIAWLPARIAARTRPATVLRSE